MSHNIGYFYQLEQFGNGSTPNHILADFIYSILFYNLELHENQVKLNLLLNHLISQSFEIKKYFIKTLNYQLNYDKGLLLSMFSAENVLTLFEICDDFKIDSKINPINMVFDYISKKIFIVIFQKVTM